MYKRLIKQSLLWGIFLWVVGYVFGILLIIAVPGNLIGWVIAPVGLLLTVWVLLKKISLNSLTEYIVLGIIWVLIAVVCDYLLLVSVFKPADGYYKLDVFLYYILTLTLPIFIGLRKTNLSKDKRNT